MRPHVTADALIAALKDTGVLDEKMLISLLGPGRSNPSVNAVEMAVARENLMSPEDLLELKCDIAGLPAFKEGSYQLSDYLDPNVAARHGALVVDREPVTVVMVEDTEENVTAVEEALGTKFQVWLTTAAQFASLRRQAYTGNVYEAVPYCADLFAALDYAIASRASDLHIKVGVPPRVRVDGSIRDLPFKPVDKSWVKAQIEAIAEPRLLRELEETCSADFAYTFGAARFRVNAAMDANGYTMTLRQLPSTIPTADDLGLPQAIRDFVHLERGLVLVTGPTGSGKSTTLAAVLGEIIDSEARHVITLEDPIEFRFPTDRVALVNQREYGKSFLSFSEGLRDALRQDPDVVLVGELRDADTIKTAITAAETGHLVFGTLHTYDAASTVMRVVNSFPANEQDAVRTQLATLLKGVVSQSLLPRASGKGRVAAYEIMLNNTAISANLRKPDGHSQLKQTMQTALADGMVTMEASLARLVVTGLVTKAEAEFRARDVPEFTRMLEFYTNQVNAGVTP